MAVASEPAMIAFAEAIKKHLKHHYPKLDMNKDRTHFLWSPQFLDKFNPPAAPSVSPEMIDLANFVAAQDPALFAHLSEFLEAEAFMIQEQKLRASQGQQARERLEQERTGKVALDRYRQAKITETKLEQHGKASDSLIDREGTTSGHSSTVVINGKRFIQIPDDPAPSFASTPLLPGIEAHAQSAFPRHDPPPNGGYGAYGPSASAANLSSLSPTVRTVLEESAPTFKNTGDELVSRTRQIEARNARRSQELSSKGTKRHFYTGLGIASKRPKTAAAPIEELNGSPEVLADPVIDEDPLGPVAVTKTKRGGDTVLDPEYISSHHSSDIVEHADQATHGVVEDTPEDQEADYADKSSISSTEEDPTLVEDLKEVLQRYGEVLHDFVAVVRREAREAVRAVVREELRKEREQNTE
ncbi:hypothetical protein SLS60_005328 [Paraconiothyrium brasiliense]|uniref:Uncharacterized protein n=1 Tax=Paraconiothyrium brasiliense TaxID=300254 RepID=A0ABR3RHH9_9PLEO